MSIRRKSTTHDLAILRLHPDGSRVQQSSATTKRRIARSTVVDPRGNWIAKDAGGTSAVKKRKKKHRDDGEGEFIDLSDDEENGIDASHHTKGKQRACNTTIPEEDLPQETQPEQLDARTIQRLAFPYDLSFLDPTIFSVSSLEESTGARDQIISFSDPASDLLKSIHHFASCYYGEKGQLFDSSRYFRGRKRERYKKIQENIHTIASEAHNAESDTDRSETVDETSGEDEDGSDTMDAEGSRSKAPRAKDDAYRKDMYKAFDGSSLMAIGIVLQEYVAHMLSSSSRPRIPDEP